MNNLRNKQQFCLKLFCFCSHYQLHYHSLNRCLYDNTKYYNLGRYRLVGSVNCCGIIGLLIKPQLALVFVCFHSLLSVFLLKSWQDLARSYIFLALLIRILRRFLPRRSRKCKILINSFKNFYPGQ